MGSCSVTTLAAVMLYLHRFCLGFAERYIKDDLGLTTEQVGVLFSAAMLGEPLTLTLLLSGALIVAGALLAYEKPRAVSG